MNNCSSAPIAGICRADYKDVIGRGSVNVSALERHLEPKQERERVPDRRIRVRMNDVLQIRLHGDRLRDLGEITQLDRGFRSLRRRADLLLLLHVARAVAGGGDGDPDLVLRSGKEAQGDEPRAGIGSEAVY